MKEWCATIKQLVNDSGKKIVEELKSSSNPAKLKFIKNEDICTLLKQSKVGVLTAVPVTPEVSPSTSQLRKKELTTIKEVEVSLQCDITMCFTNYNLRSLEIPPAGQWAPS